MKLPVNAVASQPRTCSTVIANPPATYIPPYGDCSMTTFCHEMSWQYAATDCMSMVKNGTLLLFPALVRMWSKQIEVAVTPSMFQPDTVADDDMVKLHFLSIWQSMNDPPVCDQRDFVVLVCTALTPRMRPNESDGPADASQMWPADAVRLQFSHVRS